MAGDVDVAEGRPNGVLYKAVLNAVRESRFATVCQGRSITLRFEFVLEEPVHGREPTKPYFGAPNRFWIVAAPQYYQP
jgi:hypothetical protein